MKKSRLLNSELSYEIAKIGHTAHITLCDAGLPIPQSVKRIDLAVEAGLPGLINVLDPVLSEMQVEEIILAEEIKEKNMPMYEAIMKSFKEAGMNPKVVFVPHVTRPIPSKGSPTCTRTIPSMITPTPGTPAVPIEARVAVSIIVI